MSIVSIYNPLRAVMAGDRKDIFVPKKMKLQTAIYEAKKSNNKRELTNEVCKIMRKEYIASFSKQLSNAKRYH